MVWQFGPYRVEDLIARGGMGEVARAYDTRHDRIVALKLLPPQLADDREYRERFKREAHAAARLREPHVIPIHAYGEIDGRLYLDMRLVEGEDVSKLIHAHGAMYPASAVDVIAQVARALDAAHGDGLVHRDVKPSNILLSDGFAYLVDFGIAYAMSGTTITSTGIAVGTIDYMAPERFDDRPIDGRADVYSLACVLYQCLTGSKPFVGETTPALINAHLNHYPLPPSSIRPNLPAALDAVIARGMAKNPAARYATAGEFATAAQQALTSPQTVPRSSGGGTGPKKWWWGVAVVGVVAAVAAALIVLPQFTKERKLVAGERPTARDEPVPPQPSAQFDLDVSVPLSDPECDGSFAVIVGAAVNPARYTTDVQGFLNAFPGASYLHVPSSGCGSLKKRTDEGADIYSIYFGPFGSESSACAKRDQLGGDAYVKSLENTPEESFISDCQG